MVRSPMQVPGASIIAVRLTVLIFVSCSSLAALLAWAAAAEQTGALFVALRINAKPSFSQPEGLAI